MSEQPTSTVRTDAAYGGDGIGDTTTWPTSADPNPTRPTRRPLAWNAGTDLGLLLLRFAVGGVFFGHGMQKVFGIWGGPGIAGFSGYLRTQGFVQTDVLAWITGIGELVAGAFVVLGVFTPLAAAGLVSIMINSTLLKAGNGFFLGGTAGVGAVELDVVLGLAAAAIALTGAGRIALEKGSTWNRRPAAWGVLCLALGVAAGVVVFLALRSAPPVP